MNLEDAQRDMRAGYYDGASGIVASGAAWLIAACVAINGSPTQAVIALFVGGMFIHPAGVALDKLLGRSGNHTRGNPLGTQALEGTIQMLLCLPLAYAVSLLRAEWFFPAMLLVIGGRYLTFHTLYGLRIYWLLGGVLAAAAFVLVGVRASSPTSAFVGATIELLFAAIVFFRARLSNAGSQADSARAD